MITMTSLDAQNQFGALIDASQRQPVTVTRRGRPVAVMLSYEDYGQRSKTIPSDVAQLIAQHAPLTGRRASESLREHFATMSNLAAEEGLSEADVMELLRGN